MILQGRSLTCVCSKAAPHISDETKLHGSGSANVHTQFRLSKQWMCARTGIPGNKLVRYCMFMQSLSYVLTAIQKTPNCIINISLVSLVTLASNTHGQSTSQHAHLRAFFLSHDVLQGPQYTHKCCAVQHKYCQLFYRTHSGFAANEETFYPSKM